MHFRHAAAAAAAAALSLSCAGRAAAPPPATQVAPPRDYAGEAYAARKANDFAKAEAIATAGVDAGQASAKLYFERGVARMALGNKEGALEDLRKLDAIQEDPSALLLSGSILMQLARWPEAEKDLARAVQLAPDNARAWASLAQARIALRDLPGATAAHEKALALAPNDAFVKEVGDRLARAASRPADPAAAPPPGAAPALQPAAAAAPAPAGSAAAPAPAAPPKP
ncbi:MAG TPA: tetratricopeptide repeat protein [Anaeromyxobacter sp.]|nr:tetratricopeptide repeat protein [Anaeromyxobacter sp.]